MAAEAGGRQGKFWQMHDRLFQSRGRLADDDLRRYALELELDMAQFEADLQSDEIEKAIRQGRLAGARSGVNGTPTFFINGHRYDGEHTFDALSDAVSNALQ